MQVDYSTPATPPGLVKMDVETIKHSSSARLSSRAGGASGRLENHFD